MPSIVFTFGRMNPPTKGHERLISKVVETAKTIGGDHIVYLSHTQNNSTDPLDWKFKKRICEAAFPGVRFSKNEKVRTPFQALESFKGNFDKVILVVGGDQINEFATRMTPYAKEWGFDFSVISAGERIDESDGVDGMSASKMRKYALENNKDKFYSGLPGNLREGAKDLIFNRTQKELKKIKTTRD